MKAVVRLASLACLLSTALSVRIVCHFLNWSVYGPGFKVEDIDAKLCTHIVYSFFGLDDGGKVVSLDPWNDVGDEWHEGNLKKMLKLKESNPSTKIMLAVGGWNMGHLKLQALLRSPEKRRVFLESSLSTIGQFKFDGLEMSWIYDNGVGGTKEDKEGLTQLVREMKPRYQAKGYLLSLSMAVNPVIFDNSYDVPALSKHVDFINVLAYDLHGPWERQTGHVAPLRRRRALPNDRNNVEDIVGRFLEKGALAGQLNLGVVGYGASFTLSDPKVHGMNASATGPGKNHPFPYRLFCLQDKNGLWTKFWDEEQVVPYAVCGDQWTGYEDVRSLREKAKFARSARLGGLTFWSLDVDDFKGRCDSGKFPLLKAANDEMRRRLP